MILEQKKEKRLVFENGNFIIETSKGNMLFNFENESEAISKWELI